MSLVRLQIPVLYNGFGKPVLFMYIVIAEADESHLRRYHCAIRLWARRVIRRSINSTIAMRSWGERSPVYINSAWIRVPRAWNSRAIKCDKWLILVAQQPLIPTRFDPYCVDNLCRHSRTRVRSFSLVRPFAARCHVGSIVRSLADPCNNSYPYKQRPRDRNTTRCYFTCLGLRELVSNSPGPDISHAVAFHRNVAKKASHPYVSLYEQDETQIF